MRTYGEWKCNLKGKAHLLARDISQGGYIADQLTLCGKSKEKLDLKYSACDDDKHCTKCAKEQIVVRKELIGESNVVRLDERSFIGRVSGAYHFSGSIKLGRAPAIDLTFELTYLQARTLNAADPSYDLWEAGAKSNRFFSQKAMREHVTKIAREFFPDVKAVFAGYGPCEVVVVFGNDELAEKLNVVNDEWEHQEDDDEASKVSEQKWKALMEEGGLKI